MGRQRFQVVEDPGPSSDPLEGERRLVERARTDPSAFGELFDKYHDPILAYLVHRTADVALAQDLTSNTFFKALRGLSSFRWRRIPFSAWLYRIASNEAAGHHRRRRRLRSEPLERLAISLPDPAGGADRELAEAEERVAESRRFLELHRGISRLSPKYQEVVVLRYFENKSLAEIAEITGRSVGTVKSNLHRAQGRLRQLLDAASLERVDHG